MLHVGGGTEATSQCSFTQHGLFIVHRPIKYAPSMANNYWNLVLCPSCCCFLLSLCVSSIRAIMALWTFTYAIAHVNRRSRAMRGRPLKTQRSKLPLVQETAQRVFLSSNTGHPVRWKNRNTVWFALSTWTHHFSPWARDLLLSSAVFLIHVNIAVFEGGGTVWSSFERPA